jgi:ferredoxin
MTDRAYLKMLVLLCTDLENLGHGLDLEEVRKWLQEMVPAVHVQVVPDLEHRTSEIASFVASNGAVRLVLGLCPGKYPVAEVQVQARKAGLDPLGVEVVNLGAYAALAHPRPQATEKAKSLLAAAVARARAFPGSRPENVKPYLPAAVSRRSLFTLSLLEYRPVPSIQRDRCTAERGCQLCIQACPREALGVADGRIWLEKPRCENCGLCLTACPREAIQFPGYAPVQWEAQIRTLVSIGDPLGVDTRLDPAMDDIEQRGILFTCQRAPEPEGACHASWMPVQLPCVGMAPPSWFLAPLLMGATAVGVLPCNGECPMGQDEVIAGRVAYCQEFLQLIGAPAGLVRLSPALDQFPEGNGNEETRFLRENGFLHKDMAHVLLRLAEEYNVPSGVALEHPHSPLGIVEVREDVCTGCGMCAMACPTDALDFEQTDGSISLTFDAALCTACGQCLPRCPEAERGAIRLSRRTDLERLRQGRVCVYREEMTRCIACGAPFAPGKMIERIKELLGSEYTTTTTLLTRYCPSCRSGVSREARP